jgi:succinate dehydrogenase/fumarate reductase flavoprotein subunit
MMSYWTETSRQLQEWPYPIRYEEEREIDTDVLVLGGGIAGCWAAISAAKKGAKVALVEKGATIRSGAGGPGCDHWCCATTNPGSKLSPEEFAQALIDNAGQWTCGISTYIKCRESYETLLELEKMGAKIRDTEDEFKGAEFRDESTKLLFAYDYENKTTIRVWGTTFKPALYKECKRLGVDIYDRVMATSLLTEGGIQGGRVLGATGINVRTGEFHIFKAGATVLCTSKAQALWVFSTELTGITTFRSRAISGDGTAMAWRAGAELNMMEKSGKASYLGTGYAYPHYGTGNPFNTWYPCSIVDSNGKEIPWLDRDGNIINSVSQRLRPAPGQKFYLLGGQGPTAPRNRFLYEYMPPSINLESLSAAVARGELELPLYADVVGMPPMERKALWGLMVGQESKTKTPVRDAYGAAGFDPDKDMLQSYLGLSGETIIPTGMAGWRTVDGGSCGGVFVDWDLKTTLDGLYCAGDQLYAAGDHTNAATTGRYAGRKAAYYALNAHRHKITQSQVEEEKARIYRAVRRKSGMDWKELHAGICRIMQIYCGDNKTEKLLNIGLDSLREIQETQVPMLYATDPHKLMRSLEDTSILTCAEIMMQASLARKASNDYLGFIRTDYPTMNPPEWDKFITVKLENGKVRTREVPLDYWEPLKENYESHNVDPVGATGA